MARNASATSWADLRGRRVGLWGLGVEGRASLRRLRADGIEPVLVDRAPGATDDGTPVLGLADGGLDALAACDVVVKSPGISPYGPDCRHLLAHGVHVRGGLGLWLAGADRSRVACITGTKGKSTTTSMAGALLTGFGERHLLGGNIGVPPWDPDVDSDVDWWVVETSSYQAVDIEVGPQVVAVTSLSEDHVPWHDGSVETYYRDKLSLCTRPGVRTVVADRGDRLLRARTDDLGPSVRWVGEAGPWVHAGPVHGAHNRRNAEIARQTLLALGVPGTDDPAALAGAFACFQPLPGRLAVVAQAGGTTFVDDSISTNVLSTAAALASFPGRRIGLLVGGLERNIDYRPLAASVREDVRVFTMPTNGPAIGAVLRAAGVDAVCDTASLADAVAAAYGWAQPDGVVLLSPAAASFDLFTDHRARGAAFTALARSLAD